MRCSAADKLEIIRLIEQSHLPQRRILLENHYLPGALKADIEAFVDHYNHRRYHESLNNLTPAD
jgi:putative transposase